MHLQSAWKVMNLFSLVCRTQREVKARIFTARKQSLQGYVFTGVCLSTGGACVAGGGGLCGRGHAWWGVCMAGGACMAGGGLHGRGHVWQGACMAGGMCGRGVCMSEGHAWQGACMAGGMCGGGSGICGRGEGHVWQGGMCGMHVPHPWQIPWDTVNELAVSILLECILVT